MVLVLMLVLVLVVMMPLHVMMGLMIFGFRKKRKGLRRLEYAATAKSPRASSRNSQKINGGKYKWLLLLFLSVKKQDR